MLCLCVSTEVLLDSFNTQDQAPDDPSSQDCQCVPRDFFVTSLHFRQVLSWLPILVSTKSCQMSSDCPLSSPQIPVGTPPTSPQALSRKEIDDNWEEVLSACNVVNRTPTTGYLARFPTKHNILQRFHTPRPGVFKVDDQFPNDFSHNVKFTSELMMSRTTPTYQ